MQLIEAFFIVTVTLWLSMLPIYFLLVKFTPKVKLTARNKASLVGNTRQDHSQLRGIWIRGHLWRTRH